MYGFRTHTRIEFIAVFFDCFKVLLVAQQLAALKRGQPFVDDDIGLEVQHAFDLAQRHVEQQADARRQRLQKPDVRDRAGQFNVTHTLTSNASQGNFNATLFAHHTTVLQTLVLTTQALVVFYRAKNLCAEQTIALGLKGSVVDGLRLFHLAVGPGSNHLGRCQADTNSIEVFVLYLLFVVEQ